MHEKIKLNVERKKEMIVQIKNFFLEKREEEIGDLAATFLLDFIIDKLAAEFYNQGVYDAYKHMSDRVEDLFELQIY